MDRSKDWVVYKLLYIVTYEAQNDIDLGLVDCCPWYKQLTNRFQVLRSFDI